MRNFVWPIQSMIARQKRAERVAAPAYLELASEIEAKIRSGELRPGSQLPPQRDLARERSVNVSTVTRAYRELQNLNLVVGSTRRGTIVTAEGAMPRVDRATTPAGFIDLTVNRPAVDDFQKRLAETLPQLAARQTLSRDAGVPAAGGACLGARGRQSAGFRSMVSSLPPTTSS